MKETRTIARWLYAAVASVGLTGVAMISFSQFTGASACPSFGVVPACYVILACYAAVFVSAFIGDSQRPRLFWPGFIGVISVAAYGSSMELAGHVTCPRSGGGTPTCYFSFAMSIAILALYVWANRPNGDRAQGV